MNARKIIAREWLFFIACLPLGALCTYAIYYHGQTISWREAVVLHPDYPETYLTHSMTGAERFFAHLWDLQAGVWLPMLLPWSALLFVRSIVVSIRSIRPPQPIRRASYPIGRTEPVTRR